MGPPLKAAENEPAGRVLESFTSISFNGAAAKSSGKCTNKPVDMASLGASMGPPLKAAENVENAVDGKTTLACFNGAAAKSSGKYYGFSDETQTARASMGPPLKAAENTPVVSWSVAVDA